MTNYNDILHHSDYLTADTCRAFATLLLVPVPGQSCVVSITDTRGGVSFHVSAGELQ